MFHLSQEFRLLCCPCLLCFSSQFLKSKMKSWHYFAMSNSSCNGIC